MNFEEKFEKVSRVVWHRYGLDLSMSSVNDEVDSGYIVSGPYSNGVTISCFGKTPNEALSSLCESISECLRDTMIKKRKDLELYETNLKIDLALMGMDNDLT